YGRLYTVHRLDKDTSGVICFARNEEAHKYLSSLFQGRDIEKYYVALVNGRPMQSEGSIKEAIAEHPVKKGKMTIFKKGKPSHTDREVLNPWNGYSKLQLQNQTGRPHPLRVRPQHPGKSLVGDPECSSGRPRLLSSVYKKFLQ